MVAPRLATCMMTCPSNIAVSVCAALLVASRLVSLLVLAVMVFSSRGISCVACLLL